MDGAADKIDDIGPQPHMFDIERATKANTNYRSVAWSGRYLQVTLMSIPVGGSIGFEVHPETDQFLRLDAGSGRVQMGAAKEELTFEKEVSEGWCVLVPAGTWHNISNIGATPMQVYAIYAPAHHTPGKVHPTAAAASADKNDEPATWSVQPTLMPDKHARLHQEALDQGVWSAAVVLNILPPRRDPAPARSCKSQMRCG